MNYNELWNSLKEILNHSVHEEWDHYEIIEVMEELEREEKEHAKVQEKDNPTHGI